MSRIPPGSHADVGAQRHCWLTHEPRGRVRTMRPSSAIRVSTQLVIFCVPP
jgi:hypothetical protein